MPWICGAGDKGFKLPGKSIAKSNKAKHPIKYLSLDEWDKLNSLKKSIRDEVIIRLLYETGCTVNELVSVKKSDFDFKRRALHIYAENSRNHSPRVAFISKGLMRLVRKFINETEKNSGKEAESEYLFSTRQSQAMTTKRVRQIVHKYCSLAGIKTKNPQVIRYTHIVHAYMKGIPFNAIITQVGLKRSRAIEIFAQLPELVQDNAYNKFFR